MLKIRTTSRFEKDYARAAKRGNNLLKIKKIISDLSQNQILERKYKDHKLTGSLAGSRECHIEPDWLLIYKTTKDELILERTGTHADLFE